MPLELTPEERQRILERLPPALGAESFQLSRRDGTPIPDSLCHFNRADRVPLPTMKRTCLVKAINQGINLAQVDLSYANLENMPLLGLDLRDADLRGANLHRADLTGSDLGHALLMDANLSGACLREVNFSGAILRGANLSRADLRRADFRGAMLRGADLSGTNRVETGWAGAELEGIIIEGYTVSVTIFEDTPTTEKPGRSDPMSMFESVEKAVGRKTPPTLMNYSDSPAAVYGGAYVLTASELARLKLEAERTKGMTLPDLLLMGVELEVEPFNPSSSLPDKEAQRLARSVAGWAILKSDGSLGVGGREIVTRPMTLDAHRVAWMAFFNDKPYEYLSSWKSERCGLHVHLNRAAISPLTEGKLISFLNAPSNVKFTQDIAGRNLLHNEYAAIAPLKKITEGFRKSGQEKARGSCKWTVQQRLLTGGNRTGHRRTATNISSRNDGTTLEVRIFRGNIGCNGVFRVLEFLHALVSYLSLNTNSAATVDNWLDFVTWLGEPENLRAYPEFYQWLLVKKYLFPKPIRNISKAPQLLREKRVALLKFSLGEDEPTDIVEKKQPSEEEARDACVSF